MCTSGRPLPCIIVTGTMEHLLQVGKPFLGFAARLAAGLLGLLNAGKRGGWPRHIGPGESVLAWLRRRRRVAITVTPTEKGPLVLRRRHLPGSRRNGHLRLLCPRIEGTGRALIHGRRVDRRRRAVDTLLRWLRKLRGSLHSQERLALPHVLNLLRGDARLGHGIVWYRPGLMLGCSILGETLPDPRKEARVSFVPVILRSRSMDYAGWFKVRNACICCQVCICPSHHLPRLRCLCLRPLTIHARLFRGSRRSYWEVGFLVEAKVRLWRLLG
jgi:hypothetical protein